MQSTALVRPVVPEYVPAAQGSQTEPSPDQDPLLQTMQP